MYVLLYNIKSQLIIIFHIIIRERQISKIATKRYNVPLKSLSHVKRLQLTDIHAKICNRVLKTMILGIIIE